jgi:lipopolysaccharide/colanic/teichoic acid biosynthesis glycosyltransferase
VVKPAATEYRRPELRRRELLNEQDFTRWLCLERRRSERSERPFLVMLVDGGPNFLTSSHGSPLQHVIDSLTAVTRDTDVLGWYKDGAVLAVLFTELSDPALQAAGVIQARIESALKQNATKDGGELGITLHLFPESGAEGQSISKTFTFYPDLERRTKSRKIGLGIKRSLDIFGSLFALILLSPLMLTIALAIKLTSKGPALLKQTRLGQCSRPFTFLKFRSMYVDCDPTIHEQYVSKLIHGGVDAHHSTHNGSAVFKIKNDPRVTRVGRFLRKTSLDELPQFINVLKGDMSLVGPRPPLPYEAKQYTSWHRRRMIEAKPGITGLWQVTGRSRTNFDDMVRLDLQYVEQASLSLDLKILLQTPGAVFSGEGAY